MYIPQNREFGSDLSKLRNFGGGGEWVEPPKPHPRYATGQSLTKGKGKALPEQALTGPEGSRRLRLPDFMIIGT
jgi:hypothetical protein